jgi:zinc protease
MANYGHSSRFYVLVALAKTGSVRASLKDLLLVKESLSRYGFTQDETDRAKSSLLSYMEQVVSEKDFQESDFYVDSFTRHFLKGETVPDLEWELDAVTKLLPGISLKEINSAVKNYFSDDDLTAIISAPEAERSSLPDNNEIKAIAAEVRRAKIEAPKRELIKGELLDAVPEKGIIVSETVDNETGAVRLLLGNGAEVILKETKNKNSEISFYAQARGGTLSASDKMAVSAELSSEMINVSGLGPYSRTDLTKLLLDKQVGFTFWTQKYLRGFQGSAAVKDIKVLFEMLYHSFTRPRIDSEAVSVMLEQLRSRMEFEENDPNRAFSREISRTVSANPRFHPLELRDLDKADTDEALEFIEACLNPADYTFIFTGSIDLSEIRSLAQTYLASIPGSISFNEWSLMEPQRPSSTEKEIHKGKEERSTVYMSWYSPASYSEEKAAAVSVLSEYLDIQLTEEIREALGGVYSISSWVSLSPIPRGELSGGAYFSCDPKRADELLSAVKEEFRKIAAGNIDANVLEKSAKALIKSHETSIQSNLYLAQSYANSAVIYQSPLSRLDKRPALYRSVTSRDIQYMAADLVGGNLVRLILLPEK